MPILLAAVGQPRFGPARLQQQLGHSISITCPPFALHGPKCPSPATKAFFTDDLALNHLALFARGFATLGLGNYLGLCCDLCFRCALGFTLGFGRCLSSRKFAGA